MELHQSHPKIRVGACFNAPVWTLLDRRGPTTDELIDNEVVARSMVFPAESTADQKELKLFVDNRAMGLEIAFHSKELRSTCESPTRAKRELGDWAASALRRYLADLEAVETVAELIDVGLEFTNCGPEVGLIRFELSEERYLYCAVNHLSIPMSGEVVDWTKVTRLKVIHIGGER